MTISTAILSSQFIVTLEKVIYEWLTDSDCFGSGSSRLAEVSAGIKQDAEAEGMRNPWCELVVSSPITGKTGAGACNTESSFKHISVEIAFRTKRPGNLYDLTVLGDRLDNYFRNATKGRPALGGVGIRMANLSGPFPDDSERYYLRRWFLTGRVRVSNA